MTTKLWQCRLGAVSIIMLGIVTASLFISGEDGPRPAFAKENAVTFPPLDQLEHYTTVRRGVTREHMLTSRAAIDAIKAKQPVPVGTHVVLVDYQDDVLTRYLVSQKLGEGIDDWGFQWFWPDQSVKADENVAQCYSCHQRSRRERQFMFTFSDALSFEQ